MFTLSRIVAVIPAGALQPTQLQVVGSWACPNGANSGVPLELRITSPGGAPTTVFTATTNNGTNGPIGTVTFVIPAWPGAACGMKFAAEVRGLCQGVFTPWDPIPSSEVSCAGCPRIQMQAPAYGACVGSPASQDVTLSATVMLAPGQTTTFTWDLGDGNTASTGPVTNTTNNVNHPITLTHTHTYADSAQGYRACLIPQNGECPTVCVDVQTTCSSVGCPTVVGSATYGACKPNDTRPTTYTLSFNPPLPAQSTAQISWAYGAANLAPTSQIVNTSGGPVASVQHTIDLAHRSGGYNTTATVVVLVNGQLCPLTTTVASITADPPPCVPCPTPGNPVSVSITTPSAGWCAPVPAALSATLQAQVNWPTPAPNNPPQPVHFDWVVTSPAGGPGTATRQGGASVTTDTGWSGAAANANGSLKLNAPGTYTVSVAAVFAPASGLPTDATGTIICNLVGGASFSLPPCQTNGDCPELTGLTATVGCIDTASGTPASATLVASVNDPAGTAQSFTWDFGDPQSPGNQSTTATPTVTHSYPNAGTFTVTCRVNSANPQCQPRGANAFARSISVAACQKNDPPPPRLTGCAVLLWTSLILMLVGLLSLLVGCMVSVFVPAPPGPVIALVLAIVGAALLVIGGILFLIWWAVCRFLTGCDVILAAWTFMGIMIAVFAVIATVIGIMALFGLGTLPCFIGALASFGYWGLLYWIMSQIAVAAGCLSVNPGGPVPPTAASSGALGGDGAGRKFASGSAAYLASGPQRQRGALHIPLPGAKAGHAMGLGDLVTRATSAIGIQPCQACHERAAKLNQLATLGGTQAKSLSPAAPSPTPQQASE